MIFVTTYPVLSSDLRGKHIADELGCKVLDKSIGDARGETVVIVKDAADTLVARAKDRGNRIVYDPLDQYCAKGRPCSFRPELADVVIVPNATAAKFYPLLGFKKAEFAVIPHQWDPRITGEAPQDRVRAAYIGNHFNCPPWWDGDRRTDMLELPEFAKYNLHLSLNQRDPLHIVHKPALKVASAAAVGANVVAYRDPAALELLGDDYPFYVDDDPKAAIRMAREAFGTPAWDRGREIMKKVKEKTSVQAVAALYRQLDRPTMKEAA